MIVKKVHIDLCLKLFVLSDLRQLFVKRICIRKLHECENVLFSYKCIYIYIYIYIYTIVNCIE